MALLCETMTYFSKIQVLLIFIEHMKIIFWWILRQFESMSSKIGQIVTKCSFYERLELKTMKYQVDQIKNVDCFVNGNFLGLVANFVCTPLHVKKKSNTTYVIQACPGPSQLNKCILSLKIWVLSSAKIIYLKNATTLFTMQFLTWHASANEILCNFEA